MTAPTPRAGDRWIKGPDIRGDYTVVEQTAVRSPVTNRCEVVVAEYLSLEDAKLLATGRGELARLRALCERADEIISATASVDVAGKAWAESADEWKEEYRAALAGRAAGGEGP